MTVSFFFSHPVLACSIPGDFQYVAPDWLKQADWVIEGKATEVIEQKKAPYGYLIKISVKKWLKGSGAKEIEAIESPGSNCDPVFSIERLHHSDKSTMWRIYLAKRADHLVVLNAKSLGNL